MVILAALACQGDGPAASGGVPAAVQVTAPRDTLNWIGATLPLGATVLDDAGRPVSNARVEWRSTDPAVLAVGLSGAVTARGRGAAYAVATAGSAADSVRLVVVQRAARLFLDPTDGAFTAVGETRRYAATVLDSGSVVVPDPDLTWSTSDTLVVVVDSTGEVETVGNGTAVVAAAVDSARGTVAITVRAPMAFIHANVVPLHSDGVLADQTVLVEDGAITAVGPTGAVAVPPGSAVFDATGKYLMPGLADMHVHYSCAAAAECRHDLFLYVANGVTTVRTMWGSPFQLVVRGEVERGATLGPAHAVASPGMDGPGGAFSQFTPPVTTVEEARATAAQHALAGYDFLKTYNDLTPELYAAIHEEARARGIPVLGHKPFTVRFADLVNEGHATSEHLLAYEQQTAPTGSLWSSAADLDSTRSLALLAAAAGMAETPTTAAFTRIAGEVPAYEGAPEARYVSPGVINFSRTVLPAWNVSAAARTTRLERQRAVMGVLHQAGVPLLLGTDAGVRWVLPGFAIHRELAEMVAAGLTPYEAYRTGTVNAARSLGQDQVFGTVEPGRRADLVLLHSDPLVSVANFADRAGVMVRGVWLSEPALRRGLEDIAVAYGR